MPLAPAVHWDPKMIRNFYRLCRSSAEAGKGAISGNFRGRSVLRQSLYGAIIIKTDPTEMTSFTCLGVNLKSIVTSRQLSNKRKDTLTFGFMQVVREGLRHKADVLCPGTFTWDNLRFGNAGGDISFGLGTSSCAD